ncbi:MAG: HAMP domain-containing protein [Betaproteobacteria bacterium]|nr:HAMP domain-containing protein [Betaproteobacteria bacterium]
MKMRLFRNTLKFKVGSYMALTLTMAMALFTFLLVEHQRTELREAAVSDLARLSEVITKSTRYAMLENETVYVKRIIQDVGKQPNIAKIRIWAKDGKIIHSSYPPEIGQKFDRDSDGCTLCYPNEMSVEQIPKEPMPRIFFDGDGRRMLGSMEILRNEPSCYTAACHVHKRSEPVLGVLDIIYSLDEIDQKTRAHSFVIGGLSLAFIAIVSTLMSGLVSRFVYRPLHDLEAGARRLSEGDLEHPIPVRGEDELGKVAESFNSMTLALKNSRKELEEWALTLERKVEQRTKELRIAEAETARSEKLASVGLLAAGIAHELNNPLTGVLTFSHLLRKKMPEGSQDAEDLDLVIRETKRCAAIIRRLLDFAREKPPEKKFSDLNKIIENTERIIEKPASLRDVKITLELDRELPPVWLDADLIEQVILNLMVNAQHAVEQDGDITVRTSRVLKAVGESGRGPAPMAEVTVIDTGCGIPQENLKRIFDPFFTSKEVGKGTGLGLSVTHGIVTAHGGAIEVDSQVGKGSTFRVYLPLNPPEKDPGSNSDEKSQ